jgi:hypothetical protein
LYFALSSAIVYFILKLDTGTRSVADTDTDTVLDLNLSTTT